MGLPRGAEAASEEVVTAEGGEGLLFLGPPPRLDRLAEVVVPDDPGDAAEEAEGLGMPLEEGLLALVGQGQDKRDLGVAETEAEELHRSALAVHHHQGLAEVGLRILARLVGQGDKPLRRPWPALPHIFADGGLPAREAVLRH